jgi:molybdenum cofactor cytidylyltransferase
VKFGPVAPADAEGAILAHSLRLASGALRKGRVLSADDIADLRASGVDQVTVARLDPDDMSEDDAARAIGEHLVAPGLSLTTAFTGRSNLLAGRPGVVRIDARAVQGANSIDEGLTLATLPDLMRVSEGQLVATVKVIPYGVAGKSVDAATKALVASAIKLCPFKGGRAQLVMTQTPGFKNSLLDKGRQVVEARARDLQYRLQDVQIVPHVEASVAAVLDHTMDLILILGASATSDRADVAPSAVVAAGGRIDRFGMPVDPGNLIFLGDLKGTPVVGLPGCARSPALNGVDWVLERLSAGIQVDGAHIAAMGVGGLLKEMPGRPQPRQPES